MMSYFIDDVTPLIIGATFGVYGNFFVTLFLKKAGGNALTKSEKRLYHISFLFF
jgi:hypothetical protein